MANTTDTLRAVGLPRAGRLPNDVARCDGVGFQEDDGWGWREGCETCLRRTAKRPEQVWMMDPPAIIAFECEFLIPPNVSAVRTLDLR